ncbi:MAG: P-loop NTPase [Clostridia bacterium]|nr:P-loop NTPase [Clostridia bacterium]
MPIYIFAGGYGSGKSSLAVNLALTLAKRGEKVTLADMDIVNPYFRSCDSEEILRASGVRVLAPQYVNTNVESPTLGADIAGAFASDDGVVIADVGGDDAGAIALGQYSDTIKQKGYQMLLVVNPYRPFADNTEGEIGIARDVEAASRLKFTAIAANPNLGSETDPSLIEAKREYFRELSQKLSLPVAFTAVKAELADKVELEGEIFPIEIMKKPGWAL